MNRLSAGLKTSSWGSHPPVFKKHFLFALYLLIILHFEWKFSVNGWMPLQPAGLSHVHTQWVWKEPVCPLKPESCVGGRRKEEPRTSLAGAPPSPLPPPWVSLLPSLLQEMEGWGGIAWEGGSEGACHVDFAPIFNSWPCYLLAL